MNKKFRSLLIFFLIGSMLLATGCTTGSSNDTLGDSTSHSDVTLGADETLGSDATGTDAVTGEGEPEPEDSAFTVSLIYNGEPYSPKIPMSAQWTDQFSVHQAEFDENGVARIEGLDGDFQVTLTALPKDITYNPNAHKATNDDRHIEIELYGVTKLSTRGRGEDIYKPIEINGPGVFQVEIEAPNEETGADDVTFYRFIPTRNGVYSVESWVDTTDNKINPQLDVYTGSFASWYFSHTLDDGGAESTYTKNFLHKVQAADENIGVSFAFGVKANSKDNTYPITITFVLQLDGGFEANRPVAPIVVPTEKFKHTPEYEGYTFLYSEDLVTDLVQVPGTADGDYRFSAVETKVDERAIDGSNYGLNEDDGYYHLFNPSTGKFDGPILYCKITQPSRQLDPLTQLETYQATLTLASGNYKLFIEGFGSLLADPPGDLGPYFCVNGCPCRETASCVGACTAECTKCSPDCRRCPAEGFYNSGYSGYVNSDGVYAVTPELKAFLQELCEEEQYFLDGQGWVESNEEYPIDAKEDDFWLFACGYYVKLD